MGWDGMGWDGMDSVSYLGSCDPCVVLEVFYTFHLFSAVSLVTLDPLQCFLLLLFCSVLYCTEVITRLSDPSLSTMGTHTTIHTTTHTTAHT